MTDREWFDMFDETKDKFKWFFMDYGFGHLWENLKHLRELEYRDFMLDIMNVVWLKLPDSKFNIIDNPKGWSEFLELLEA